MAKIQIKLERMPVCMADDCDSPHAQTLEIPSDISIKDFVLFLRENYLGSAWMGNWIIYKDGYFCDKPNQSLLRIDTFIPKIDVLSDYIESKGWPDKMYMQYIWNSNEVPAYQVKKTIPLPLSVQYHFREKTDSWSWLLRFFSYLKGRFMHKS